MLVLGIETSCDETAVALYDSERGLLGHSLFSQVKLHAEYGGVVPELASRDHVRKLLPMMRELMSVHDVSGDDIGGVAYTLGPGLIGALMVGSCVGRGLAYGWGVPAIGVHHMEGHLLAPLLEDNPPAFPFVALLVSGGHTMLVAVTEIGQYEILGESVDDAAGEAFDKVAKMLDLDYPGGPRVAALAEQGTPGRFHFPRPMIGKPGFDFSFSGLKTYTMNTISQHRGEAALPDRQTRADIARAFQDAVVDTLAIKCLRALKQTGCRRLVIAGGVSANLHLRQVLEKRLAEIGGNVFYARPEFCTDNAAMIAVAGCQRLVAGQSDGLELVPRPRWSLDSLPPLDTVGD